MHGDAEGCCEDTGTSPNFTGLPFRTPFLMPWNREHVTAAFGLPHTWESGHKGQERPLQARRLTRTAMASGRGPLVLRLSLVSSAACSHSNPSAVKVLLEASLPLGLRMKLPVTWFFTAGQGEGQGFLLPSTEAPD